MSLLLQKDGIFTYPHPYPPPPTPPPLTRASQSASATSKISPTVLFIIVILAVLFFISGLLHLLVRCLIKSPSTASASAGTRSHPQLSSSDALQRQLQQLFHLHDSGLDQPFIDALPVFHYKQVEGVKEPFDCAVCLCEFSEKDKLRLLPMCSHAFHINCIDTWLLSNSTCPLCRGTLFASGSALSIENPMYDYDDLLREDGSYPIPTIRLASGEKTADVEEVVVGNKALPVKLGKLWKSNTGSSEQPEPTVIGETSSSSSSNLDGRRCFSFAMGSYQYVVVDADLRVHFSHGQDAKETEGKKMNKLAKGESYSVSKIWLWSKEGNYSHSEHIGRPMPMPFSLKIDLPSSSNTG